MVMQVATAPEMKHNIASFGIPWCLTSFKFVVSHRLVLWEGELAGSEIARNDHEYATKSRK